MQKRKVGKSGLDVGAIGFGCMGLSFGYGQEVAKGDGISLGRSAGRNLVKLGSCFLACIPSTFTTRRQGLHDLIAGTLVQVSDAWINLLAESRSRLTATFSHKAKK